MSVVELHATAGVGQYLVHYALELEHFFFRHSISERFAVC
jgi:hypothetical protein